MGADLYVENRYDALRERTQPAFNAAVMAREEHCKAHGCGLAAECAELLQLQDRVSEAYDAMHDEAVYFRDSYNNSSVLQQLDLSWWRDVIPMRDEDGNLWPEKARELASMVEGAELESADYEPGDGYFREKRERLVRFLRSAAEAGLKIRASL